MFHANPADMTATISLRDASQKLIDAVGAATNLGLWHTAPEGVLPYDIAVRELDGAFAPRWEISFRCTPVLKVWNCRTSCETEIENPAALEKLAAIISKAHEAFEAWHDAQQVNIETQRKRKLDMAEVGLLSLDLID